MNASEPSHFGVLLWLNFEDNFHQFLLNHFIVLLYSFDNFFTTYEVVCGTVLNDEFVLVWKCRQLIRIQIENLLLAFDNDFDEKWAILFIDLRMFFPTYLLQCIVDCSLSIKTCARKTLKLDLLLVFVFLVQVFFWHPQTSIHRKVSWQLSLLRVAVMNDEAEGRG